jgi:hypothetical protein
MLIPVVGKGKFGMGFPSGEFEAPGICNVLYFVIGCVFYSFVMSEFILEFKRV